MMKMIVATALVALAGCAITPRAELSKPEVVQAETQRERDDYMKVTKFTGPVLRTELQTSFLRATRLDSGEWVTQIYISHMYGGEWRFYSSAWDSDGSALPLVKIAQKVVTCAGGCTFTEDVAIDISRAYLANKAAAGLDVKVSGRGGSMVVQVPPGYVQGFLAATK